MKIPYILLIISFLFSTPINSQSSNSIDGAHKKSLKCYSKGKSALAKKDYKKAEKHFKGALERNPEILDFKRELAATYLGSGKKQAAIDLFEEIVETDPAFDEKVSYTLYKIYDETGDAQKAKYYLSIYNDQLPDGHRNKAKIKALLNANYVRDSLMANPVPFKPEKLNPAINSENLEYLPAITADESQLIFTRRTSNQEDIYSAEMVDGQYVNAKPLNSINTNGNEGAHCISQDGKLMIFTKEASGRPGNFDLFYAVKNNDTWTQPKSIGRNINTEAWESQPSLSADGKTLYFSSNRDGGYGKSDLYKSQLKDRVWQKPENLGPVINTKGNEESPFIHADGKTLYFRSDQHPGIGSFDIFFTQKEKGNWSKVKNIGYPINTEGQEGALFVTLDGNHAYYASDGDSKGNVDIYRFEMPEALKPAPTTYVKFLVVDAKTNLPISATLKVQDLDSNELEVNKKTDANGEVLTTITAGIDYAIYVEKDGYLFYSENANFSEADHLEPIVKTVKLIAIETKPTAVAEKPEPIILKNIFFESGSAALLSTSNREIEKLKTLLAENPNLRIEIIGHTDNVGSEADNLSLSLSRAQAVQNALVNKGIARTRIMATGKGESNPIASNDNELGRSQNRRTEFIILR